MAVFSKGVKLDLKILKRNQIIIFVIAFMLITAGYLNYSTGDKKNLLATSSLMNSEEVAGIGDAKLVSSNEVVENETKTTNESSQNTNEVNQNKTDNTTIQTSSSSKIGKDDYFANSKLGRDTMYSQMLESYEKIIENASVSAEQKAIAQTEVKKINDLKNSIMITENLIKTKGFEEVVIFVNDSSVSAIVKADTLTRRANSTNSKYHNKRT